jgi:glycerol dehydrogenase-like iron-containing ADH family enzyme
MADVALQALVGPRKYIQGRGVLGPLGEHVNELGKDALVVADENVWGLAGVIAFCMSVGLPTTLEELDLAKAGREQLLTVATAATAPGETIHNMPFAVTPEMVVDAMVAADAYTRAYRQQSGTQPAAVSQ